MKSNLILVTGASGFIGQRVYLDLLDSGLRVRILLRSKSILNLGIHPNLEVAYGDLLNFNDLRAACRGVDFIVHLAGIAHTEIKQSALRKINVDGMELMLRAAISQKVKKFVFISSSLAADIEREADKVSGYATTKLDSERLLMEEHRNGNICGVILRPVNVYGAGMRGNIALLIRLISRGLLPTLPVLVNRISLVGVGDLSNAIYLSLNSERANGKTYLVTDGQCYQISEIERGIYKALGKEMTGWKLPRVLLYSAFLLADLTASFLWLFRRKWPILASLNLRAYNKLVSDNLFDNSKICEELLFQPKSTFYTELPKIVGENDR